VGADGNYCTSNNVNASQNITCKTGMVPTIRPSVFPTTITTAIPIKVGTCSSYGGVCRNKAGVCGDGAYRYVKSSDCNEDENCCVPYTVSTGKLTPTIKPVGVCGDRCVNDTDCTSGTVCAPIWWPCQQLTESFVAKLQNNSGLTSEETDDMLQNCPDVEKLLSDNFESQTIVKTPLFYGMCKKPSCINCRCNEIEKFPMTEQIIKEPEGYPKSPELVKPKIWSVSFWSRLFENLFGR